MKKIEIVTVNVDKKYNTFYTNLNENGIDIDESTFAEHIEEGIDDSIDVSEYTEVSLQDGDNYAKVYVKNINEDDSLFSVLEDNIANVGSYLDNVTYSTLSKEDEKDYEDYIENITKDC